MLAKLCGAALSGLEAFPVHVEVDVGPGLPAFTVVGLPDASVRESRERVIAAIRNSGREFPLRRITVNLAPADRRKEGSAFDLPIAVGILAASGQLKCEGLAATLLLGELSLSGSLLPLRGALALARAAVAEQRLVVPAESAPEAALHGEARVFGARTLAEACGILSGQIEASCARARPSLPVRTSAPDLSGVRGQFQARRALELAAAGGHNLLMVGPPGTGKTLLARALPGILPPFSEGEALETTLIHSIAGLLPAGSGLLQERPFRAPHHSGSAAGLVGGGRGPRPGEISLAHRGVLFLDELVEFPPHHLEMLRQPMQDGRISISRANGTVHYPARFSLVAAMNPCKCGFLGDPQRECRCSPPELDRYRSRLSGPILDRMDLEVPVPRVEWSELTGPASGEPSSAVHARVMAARSRQLSRWRPWGVRCNAEMEAESLSKHGAFASGAWALAHRCAEKFLMSPRGYHRLLRVARTAADLALSEEVLETHVAEAAGLRPKG